MKKTVFALLLSLSILFLAGCEEYKKVENAMLTNYNVHKTNILNEITNYFEKNMRSEFSATYINQNGYSTDIVVYGSSLCTKPLEVKQEEQNVFSIDARYLSNDWCGNIYFRAIYKDKEKIDLQINKPIIATPTPAILASYPNFIGLIQQNNFTYISEDGELASVDINNNTVMSFDEVQFVPSNKQTEQEIGNEYEVYEMDIYLKEGKVLHGQVYTRYLPSINSPQETFFSEYGEHSILKWDTFHVMGTFTVKSTFNTLS